MARSLKALQSEREQLASAIATAHAEAHRADAGLVEAESRLVAAATTGDEKKVADAEAALRHAEAARASARRRIELLEQASRLADEEADALRRGDHVRALQVERTGLGARFLAAERRLAESLTAISLTLSELHATYQRSRATARELEDLGAKSDDGSPCYGPWSGSPPYAAGVDLVAAAYRAAGDSLHAVSPTGVPVAFHVPIFPTTNPE